MQGGCLAALHTPTKSNVMLTNIILNMPYSDFELKPIFDITIQNNTFPIKYGV